MTCEKLKATCGKRKTILGMMKTLNVMPTRAMRRSVMRETLVKTMSRRL